MEIFLDKNIEECIAEGYTPVGVPSNSIQLPAEISEELIRGALSMTNPGTAYDAAAAYRVYRPIYEHPEMAEKRPPAEHSCAEILIAIWLKRT